MLPRAVDDAEGDTLALESERDRVALAELDAVPPLLAERDCVGEPEPERVAAPREALADCDADGREGEGSAEVDIVVSPAKETTRTTWFWLSATKRRVPASSTTRC